ncbi:MULTISPECIES: GNAT family N-acetyltransferase [Streptomyces]|uniref:GNAT family N-acetyltransferase n=1 Tax=Streptomyces glycanivorans TaxID=3033808 RepID=A0ABY9JN07_9ACTN|nr:MULTISPECIES: GNAT family N-acetyltransferase [unclassified Streptomyces]WSQ81734.1 GNAT family N-acetyltransferase [Streptomyces sp. NBC_01213]TXS12984.1 GNAT family N-acetyltransferase [Streptomyces sp. wa22]WLQ68374.1 GNAT family N-acetyltransferase [Streptomyces sp. Alt3]WSQ89060.1 GNAT family N-acetyltransferase [Streptomyces sp. NBC_01212]WSR04935.1 GNAT family N-acetyltransferase [Streptomyces sp. NBC_01208]
MNRTAYVRPYRPADQEALAEICVRTADNGGDSTHLYPDPGLMPALFAEPYAHLGPELTFVLDDGSGRAVGYVLGTSDTKAFVADFREIWLPRVTDRFPEPEGEPETLTEAMTALLYRPERMVLPELEDHPAHLHIDLLPPWQRKGHGRELMGAFLDALHRKGVQAVHLSMLTANTLARAFYDRLGFHVIDVPDPGPLTYLGRSTGGVEPVSWAGSGWRAGESAQAAGSEG